MANAAERCMEWFNKRAPVDKSPEPVTKQVKTALQLLNDGYDHCLTMARAAESKGTNISKQS